MNLITSPAAIAWLLLAIVLTLAFVALCVVVAIKVLQDAWRPVADQLEYRTADWSAIDTQTRKLQAQVPDVPTTPLRTQAALSAGRCNGNCNQGRTCTCTPA